MGRLRYQAALVLGAFALSACGGYDWRSELRRRAAVQHDCPVEHVAVVGDDGNELSRRARVDVCGDERLYHHMNNGATYDWRDETDTAEGGTPIPPP